MDRRKAKKLKIGDMVIGPKVGIYEPLKITAIIHSHKDAKAKVPLFRLDGETRGPVTYRALEIPSCDPN